MFYACKITKKMFTYYSIVFMSNIKLCVLKSTIELGLKAAVVIIKNDH